MLTNQDIHKYNEKERYSRTKLPNLVLQAFDPVTFKDYGYPTSITTIEELWRFHDVMQEGRAQRWLKEYFGSGISIELYSILTECLEILSAFASTLFKDSGHVGTSGLSASISSLGSLQKIQFLLSGNGKQEKHRVLEIGPGSGYLALQLALCGVHTYTLEATQALYLYQQALYLFTEQYLEDRKASFASVTQVPWWEFVDESQHFLAETSLICANHMLNEMHPNALRLILSNLNSVWPEGSNNYIIADYLGGGKQDTEKLNTTFKEFGFNCVSFGQTFIWARLSDESLRMTALGLIMHLNDQRNRVLSIDQVSKGLEDKFLEQTPDQLFLQKINITT